MSGLAVLPWLPVLRSAAVNIGVVQVSGQSGGAVNFGVASIREGGGAGGSTNQLVRIAGDGGLSWINVGTVCTCTDDGTAPDGKPGASPEGGGWQAARMVESAVPATFRFRWDGPAAVVRTDAPAKEGRHARRPPAASRGPGEVARRGATGGAAR